VANQAAGHDALVGQTLGHYRIAEKIGAGGMAEVYRARDLHLDRDVAIKVLPPGALSDESSRKRFRQEALALSKLNHPNIATVHDFDTQQGVDFLVMEYIPGLTLENKLGTGPLLPSEVVRLGIQFMQGLSTAHEQGIVHRDLKPANLRLTPDGRLKILDFGLAQLLPKASPLGLTATLTQSQEVTGTLPYMAPEQLRGELSDARSDVWAAGAVLYEMATGQRPFPESNGPLLINAILNQAPEPPSKVNHRVSPGLENVILKALEKDAARRYQSVRELRVDLERLTAGVSGLAKPKVGLMSRLIAAGLTLLILGAVLGAYFFFHGRKSAGPPANAPVKRRPSVAVLGFKNLAGQPEAAWLSTALSEMFATELGAGEQLRVISGENVARTKIDLSLPDTDSFAQDTLTKIRQNLGSDVVVLGSYVDLGEESGGQIRLDLRVQETVAGETLPMVSERGTEKELFVLVSKAGAKLRKELGVEMLSASETSSVQNSLPENPEAARLYSEGLMKLRLFDALAARELLDKAAAAEPKYAPAHSALAEAWSLLGYTVKAQAEAQQAFELCAGFPREQRLLIEGRHRELTSDWEKAIKVYRTLFDFFPDNLEYGLRLASTQTSASRVKEALGTLEVLRKLPPPARDDPRIDLVEGNAAESLADYARELAAALRAGDKAKAEGANLLVAKALDDQAWALLNLGKLKQAATAAGQAKEIYGAAGDEFGVSRALADGGTVLLTQGDVTGARHAYQESLDIARKIGNKHGEAAWLNQLANCSYRQGNLAEAKKRYEQTVFIWREIGDKRYSALAIASIANVLLDEGDLAGASGRFRQAIALSQEVGDKRGTANTMNNLGNVLFEQGNLAGAQKAYEDVRKLYDEIGDKSDTASVISALGDIFLEQDDLAEARQQYTEALRLRREMGEQASTESSLVVLAELSLEEGHAAEAQGPLREALAIFRQQQMRDDELATHLLLSRALRSLGKRTEAESESRSASELVAHSQNRALHLDYSIESARVRAASGQPSDLVEAHRILCATLAEATKYGFAGHEFEARLSLGEIEMKLGKTTAGRTRLDALEKDARDRGFLLVARKALDASRPPPKT